MIIYYFSATGNSLKLAQDIAQAHEEAQLIPITPDTSVDVHPSDTKIGFIFPVYMGVLPELVKSFLEVFPAQKDVYYFAVSTYYTYKGIALSVVNKLLREKGAELSYSNAVSTVGTCLMEYEVKASKRPHILQRAEEQTGMIVEEIRKNSRNTSSKGCTVATRLHEKVFRFFFADAHQKFNVEENCVGCGKCEKVCPVQNISLQQGRPVWGANCQACHACVHWCPRNAIHLGKSKGRLPYHHPGITYKQLLAQRTATPAQKPCRDSL